MVGVLSCLTVDRPLLPSFTVTPDYGNLDLPQARPAGTGSSA